MRISKKCSVAIHCLICIHEFGTEKKVTSELLALSTGSNPVTIRNLLSALKKDGILSVKPGTGGAEIACPLDEITLYRICKAIEPGFLEKLIGIHAAPSPFCPVGREIHGLLHTVYAKIQDGLGASLQAVTLQEILEQYHSRSAPEGNP